MRFKNAWYRVSRRLSWMLVLLVPNRWLHAAADQCLRARLRLLERARQLEARRSKVSLPNIRDFEGQPLERSVLEKSESWQSIVVPECPIPGMLTESEKKYYLYISRFVAAEGKVVEVGTWLGMSTFFVATGLKANPRFDGKLHCFDDFVWRETSMAKWVANDANFEKPAHLDSFLPIFKHYLKETGHEDQVCVTCCKVADFYGNESLPELEWKEGPIQLAIIDCGRDLVVNRGWYRVLSQYFVPGRTLIVMQDWQNHKRVPEVYWENMKIFTDGCGSELDLIHEVREAGIATFQYRGQSAQSSA